MKQWYIFTTAEGADIYNPTNYSGPVLGLPEGNGSSKLHAIYAEDSGESMPIIDRQILTVDFIRAVNANKNSGIVILNKKFIKHENWLERQINKIIGYL